MPKRSALIEVAPGAVTHRFTSEEAQGIATAWLDAYGKQSQGVNAEAFMWHIFSGGRYQSLSGTAAREEYVKQSAAAYIVLGNDRKTAFTTEKLPSACSLSDYYVFPPNLAWTMAFTHEDGWLGPYFARHRDYTNLNQENLAAVRKLQEKAAALVKGWHGG